MNDKTGGQAADALMGIFGFKRVEEKAMDKVSETRRGLFEKWAVASLPTSLSMRGSSYASLTTQKSWEGFNAALDAVDIPLPALIKPEPPEDACDDSWLDGYAAADRYRKKCRAAIESTNLGLRIK